MNGHSFHLLKQRAAGLKNPAVLLTILCALWAAAIVYMSAGKGVRFFYSNMRFVLFVFGSSQLFLELLRAARRQTASDFAALMEESPRGEEQAREE